VAEERKMCYL